jgi:hypothetical protein
VKITRKLAGIIVLSGFIAGLVFGRHAESFPDDTFLLIAEIVAIPFAWFGAWLVISIMKTNRRIGYNTGFLRVFFPLGALLLGGFWAGALFRNIWHRQFRDEVFGLVWAIVFYRSFIYLLRNADEHRDKVA